MLLDALSFLEQTVEEVGMAAAFELLNEKVQEQFKQEFNQHERLWETQKNYSSELQLSVKIVEQFLSSIDQLSVDRKMQTYFLFDASIKHAKFK